MPRFDGKIQNELIDRAKSHNVSKLISSGIICRTRNGKFEILIVTCSPSDLVPSIEELPSSNVQDGEILTEALERGIKKEINLTMFGMIEYLFSFDYYTPPQGQRVRQFHFLINVKDTNIRLNPDKYVSYRWIDQSQIDTSKLIEDIKNIMMVKWSEIESSYMSSL